MSLREPDRVQEYIELFSNGAQGEQAFLTLRPAQHSHFGTADARTAADFVKGTARGTDIYIRANVQSVGGTTVSSVRALTVVTLDFDLKGPSHKAENLPTHPEELPRLLDRVGAPEPTVVLRTGGGLLAVWALERPLPTVDAGDLENAVALMKRFQGRIVQAAQSQGFHVDSTPDLVRACRLPGTRNWKPEYGPDGALVEIDRWSGRRISTREIEAVAADFADGRTSTSTSTDRKRKPRSGSDYPDDSNPSWEAIYAGCKALREWANQADGLLEPQWYALAGFLVRCTDGRSIFHELSTEDHRYCQKETDEKLDHALEGSAPRLCAGIEQLGGNCRGCPFRGQINSPIALGYVSDPAIAELAGRYVYVADVNGFFDLSVLEQERA